MTPSKGAMEVADLLYDRIVELDVDAHSSFSLSRDLKAVTRVKEAIAATLDDFAATLHDRGECAWQDSLAECEGKRDAAIARAEAAETEIARWNTAGVGATEKLAAAEERVRVLEAALRGSIELFELWKAVLFVNPQHVELRSPEGEWSVHHGLAAAVEKMAEEVK